MFGVARGMLLMSYLGLSAASDAFIVAYRIPNFLRKIFGEGALSSAFVPTFVELARSGKKEQAEQLMSCAFLFFEGILTLVTCYVLYVPHTVLRIAPGLSPEQVAYALPLVRILFPFILFISSSALLAGALQSVHRFGVTAFAPIVFNIMYVTGLATCIMFSLDIHVLAYWIVTGGVFHFLYHLVFYWKHFSFGPLTRAAWKKFLSLLKKFGATIAGVSSYELNMMMDALQASAFPKGSVGMLHYAGRFVGIPLGIFGVAFSTVLLPRFSRTRLLAPSRLPYYLLESLKFVFWLLLPATAGLMFFAPHIFTSFLAGKATVFQIEMSAYILRVYAIGLIFYSANRVIMNMLYALHDSSVPTWTCLAATIANFMGNKLAVAYNVPAGIALSTVVTQAALMIVSLVMLYKRHAIPLYFSRFMSFVPRCLAHSGLVLGVYACLHTTSFSLLAHILRGSWWHHFFFSSYGYWLVVAPLTAACFTLFYRTRHRLRVRLYFVS